MIYKIKIILFLLIFITSCKVDQKEITPAFYHWKTNLSISPSEKTYLQNLSIQKLYVKFFDVDWNASANQPLPIAEVILENQTLENLEIIPTIFITNRSLKNFPLEKMELLGKNILDKIFSIKNDILEIQIDCDWSESTQEKYFRLLSFLKKELAAEQIQLSATIRLHQVKYFKRTGVPPVDRGMLMFYNMDDVKDPETRNSILDLDIAKQYFYNFENYPLELDVALPIFSWGVLFRGGKMIRLLTNISTEQLADATFFLEKNKTHFEVKKSTYLDGRYLYAEDEIRFESISFEHLKTAAALLNPKISNLPAHQAGSNITVSFYHLDTTTIKNYPYEKLQEVIHFFEN